MDHVRPYGDGESESFKQPNGSHPQLSRTAFVKGTPPAENFKPWTHVPNRVALDEGVTASTDKPTDSHKIKALRAAPQEGRDLRRQTDQARLGRPGHRQPSELVPVHRVYAALSRRENGSAPERVQQPGADHR